MPKEKELKDSEKLAIKFEYKFIKAFYRNKHRLRKFLRLSAEYGKNKHLERLMTTTARDKRHECSADSLFTGTAKRYIFKLE